MTSLSLTIESKFMYMWVIENSIPVLMDVSSKTDTKDYPRFIVNEDNYLKLKQVFPNNISRPTLIGIDAIKTLVNRGCTVPVLIDNKYPDYATFGNANENNIKYLYHKNPQIVELYNPFINKTIGLDLIKFYTTNEIF